MASLMSLSVFALCHFGIVTMHKVKSKFIIRNHGN
jgi:hypothetical protein